MRTPFLTTYFPAEFSVVKLSTGAMLFPSATHYRAGILKLWTSTFLMYFGVLKLDFGNKIWKFMCRYFGKFSGNFFRYFTFLDSGFSIKLKLDFSKKI